MIEIGYSFGTKKAGILKDQPYILTSTVVGSFYKYFGGGSNKMSLKELEETKTRMLQIHYCDQYYGSHSVYDIQEKELLRRFEEDQKLKPEFQKYILCTATD